VGYCGERRVSTRKISAIRVEAEKKGCFGANEKKRLQARTLRVRQNGPEGPEKQGGKAMETKFGSSGKKSGAGLLGGLQLSMESHGGGHKKFKCSTYVWRRKTGQRVPDEFSTMQAGRLKKRRRCL